MYKQTVFISHSSLDKDLIRQIKDLINGRTSGTVDLFQSSDGESIPFGNNWIHQVEESLKKSKIMFVFVSPRSAMSSWIYFEAGFAYSKGVKVIPIGIDGIDIGSLKPPLNLLQGFNITSSEGLNNIIAILNREFDCSYPESFSEEDFERLSAFSFGRQEAAEISLNLIDNVKILFPNKMIHNGEDIFIIDDPFDQVVKLLVENDIEFRSADESTINTHGAIIRHKKGAAYSDGVSLVLDPFCLKLNEKLINSLISVLYQGKPVGKHWLNVFFESNVSLLTKDFKVSSKLHIYGFSMSDLNGRMHKFQTIDFALESSQSSGKNHVYDHGYLRVVYDSGQFDTKLLFTLVGELLRAGIVEPAKN